MKKLIGIALVIILAAAFVACGPAEKPAEETTPEQPVATPAPTPPPAPAPAKPAPAEGTEEPKGEEGKGEEGEGEEAKGEKASMGIIFESDLSAGTFRIKMDGEKVHEEGFSGGSANPINKKMARIEKHLNFEVGQHEFKFVVLDKDGNKGVQEHKMIFGPGDHKVIKLEVEKSPKNIQMKMIQ